MSSPIEYLAIRNLQTALQAITVAGGFYFNVTGAAVKLDPNVMVESLIHPGGPRPMVLIEVDPEAWEYEPASQLRLKLPLKVHWVSDATPTDDVSRMEMFFKGCADIEKAVAVDVSRGGYCSDTRIRRRTFDDAVDGTQVWAIVELELWVRRTYGQPSV